MLGEEAHIVAQEDGGPRADPQMPAHSRDEYPNLILLCPTDHTRIDKSDKEFTVARLHTLKSEHEAWVRNTLQAAGPQAKQDELWLNHLLEFSRLTHFSDWKSWTARLMNADPHIPVQVATDLALAREWLFGRIWPSTRLELRTAFENFEQVLHDYLHFQGKYFESRRGGEDLVLVREYKKHGWLPQADYERLGKQYDVLIKVTDQFVRELTCAANQICNVARATISPGFRTADGHLLVISGPYGFFEFKTHLFLYPDENIGYRGLQANLLEFSSDDQAVLIAMKLLVP